MAKATPRLGRGLSAIVGPRSGRFPPRAAPQADTDAGAGATIVQNVPVDLIAPNPRQPRTTFDESALQELADSIRARGILQPVLVRRAENERFELIAGERRWRAAKLAGIESIPALVRDLSDAESLEAALIENLQREDLDAVERAAGYQQYLDAFGVTVEQLAERLGESRANIANYLRIRRLPDEIQELIASGALGMGQARAVAGIDDPQRQVAVARLAVRRNLSVRQVEALARSRGTTVAEAPPPASGARHMSDVESTLSKALGLPVRLHPGRRKNSGRIVIRYKNLEEFDQIAERLGGSATLE